MSDNKLNDLHALVGEQIANGIKTEEDPEVRQGWVRLALAHLKANGITGQPAKGTPLADLANSELPFDELKDESFRIN